ncbi:dCTP deaminase [Adlercreutzia sp. ZJ141]|uniref:dCTP deaminase n=1 Tax=Adlercreutzia sp. ZJ141 TaxID=2709406 RepID=UPI0013ED42DD|nr:dCTP deaminase [Adlercreutzia sp. ZJ141]
MLLSDKGIRSLLDGGHDLITPFDEKKLQSASYDLTLGSQIAAIESRASTVYLSQQEVLDESYVPVDITEGVIVKPGQYVLASIRETVNLPDNLAARVIARTRFTRLGLLVAEQYCNPSYSGRLQLGLYNASPNNIALVEGLEIAQIVFITLDQDPTEEKLYRNSETAVYQNESVFMGAQFGNDSLSEGARRVYDAMMQDLMA